MKKVINVFNKIEEWFLIIAMAVMATVVFLQVLFRIFSGSLPWSEELSRYLTIWISAIGASYGFREGAHIGVDAIKMVFPVKIREFITLVSYIVVALICLILTILGIQLVQTQMSFGQLSPAMRIPMWVPYLALPVGFALCIFRNLQLAHQSVLRIKNNDYETDEVEVDPPVEEDLADPSLVDETFEHDTEIHKKQKNKKEEETLVEKKDEEV